MAQFAEPSGLYIEEIEMSGDRFPFIMGLVGLVDGLIGLVLFMFKLAFWAILIAVIYAVIFV